MEGVSKPWCGQRGPGEHLQGEEQRGEGNAGRKVRRREKGLKRWARQTTRRMHAHTWCTHGGAESD